ncbi:putative reverse transcriptase domain-containing protein [Tanacetum coccineum]
MLGLEPSDLGFKYKIEIASGQLVEIEKVIKGCRLEIESHVFDIDLIPFGHGSFDVIIGMGWLSNYKAEIICHEKVVRIPLPDGKVLREVGERLEEKVRLLMSTKASDKKQEEIVVVRDFPEEQELAFQTLKDKLCNAPVLALPDRPEDFVIELFSDYDCEIRYHPGKANVVADALSRKEIVKPIRVKAEHQRPSRLPQQPEIYVWKWEGTAKDFVTKLPRTSSGHDTIWCKDDTEKISQIKDRLKVARDRQKSYADKRRKPLESSVGDYFLLKFRLGKVGPVAYRLDLPEELNGVRDTFHVSNLKKCFADTTLQVPLDEIRVDAKLNFVEVPVEILEREFKKLKRSRIVIVKPCRSAVFAALHFYSIVNDSLGVTRMLIVIVQILDVYPSSTPKFLAADN